MRILAIECTHGIAGVAVKNGEVTIGRINGEWKRTAEVMVPLAVEAMTEAGLVPADLDAVVVSSGPGSFTALRIGMSAAKGIAFGAGCPLVPVSTLTAMATEACGHSEVVYIVPVIPSRPGEYFYARYRRRAEAGAVPEELDRGRVMAGELARLSLSWADEVAIVARDAEAFARQAPTLANQVVEASFFSARSLLPIAETALENGTTATPGEVLPDYRQIFEPLRKKQ